MKKCILVIIIILMFSHNIYAGSRISRGNNDSSIRLEVEIGGGVLRGHTTYQVGYPISDGTNTANGYFPFSELIYPLDVYMVSASARITFLKDFNVSVEFQKNVTKDSGEMEDSDWLTGSNPGQLDVFSKSNADLDAKIFDINFLYHLLKSPKVNLYVGVGYLYQNFYNECSLIRQWSPSGAYSADATGDGSISITYDIFYKIPYVKIKGSYSIRENILIFASFGLSPIASAEDEDNHLARDPLLVSKGDYSDGTAYLAVLGLKADLGKFFISSEFSYKKIEIDGTENVWEGGVWVTRQTTKVFSTQKYFLVEAGINIDF